MARLVLAGTERSIERMEAFSDAVFAIAITLLIVDIRVPPPDGPQPVDIAAELLRLWPSYFGYVFSFLVIGVYWANHHYMGKLYRRTDHVLNLLNLVFLMCIAFLPFPTRVLAEFIRDDANRQTAATFYTIGLALPAGAWLLKWLYISHEHRLIDRRLDPAFVRSLTVQYAGSFLLYLSAVFLTLIDFRLGLGLDIGLTFYYLLPPKPPVYIDSEDAKAAATRP